MKKLFISLVLVFGVFSINAQTLEALKKEQDAKKTEIGKLQGEVDAIQAKIDAMPGWKLGAFGTIGGNISGYSNWFAKGAPNSSAGNIGFTTSAYANLLQEKYFWRNSANVNLSWVKLDNLDDETDSKDFNAATDVFGLTSLFGYKLSKTLAASTLGEYRTTVIDNFNNPGYFDIGLGATWTPISDLVVVVHPLNYNHIFSKDGSTYESSTGAKFVADYTKKLGKINYKTNLSGFYSYKSLDYSNWTWINSFGYTLWKGIGVGFDFGLKQNKQEAFNDALNVDSVNYDENATLENVDNKMQSYWLIGLNYAF